EPVNQAKKDLQTLESLAPGAFYHANKIREEINGGNGDAGLKALYEKVLNDLANALTDLANGAKSLSKKYKTLDDAATMVAKDLSDAMDPANADFSTMMSDAGGSGAAGGGSGGTGGTGGSSSTGGSSGSDGSGGSSGSGGSGGSSGSGGSGGSGND